MPLERMGGNGGVGGRRQSRWLRTADGFAVCGFGATLARYLEICKRRWLTAQLVLIRIPELYLWQTFLNWLAGTLVSLFLLRGLQRHSIQDHQNQIRGHHNGRHARDGKH
jgi:hypothetical protein